MNQHSRREFLADVGRGMLVAAAGSAVAVDLGLARASLAGGAKELSFGPMEPLVDLLQQTPAERLLPILVEKLKEGTGLRSLTAAAALANARTFGGLDYVGFHTFMALPPAYHMACELPVERQPLPVLKVLYRNSARIQGFGGGKKEVLHPVAPGTLPAGRSGSEVLQEATRRADQQGAENTFAALAQGRVEDAFNALQPIVEDEEDVHRVVLAWRAWAALDLTGSEHAHTLLRQSVLYCVQRERDFRPGQPRPRIRSVLPKLLDQYRLLSRSPGRRQPDDAWVEGLAQTVLTSNQEKAADAVAAALAEGMAPDAVGEAIALAAHQLVLRDPGRSDNRDAQKPKGSVHGASVGVHASDAANAWRNIARISDQRNTVASLIVGAYHTAGQLGQAGSQPLPWAEHLEKVTTRDPALLVRQTEEAIKAKDQARASALVQRYGELGHPSRPVFDLLLRYAISEDGALHAEKYYRTVTEEFAATRPAFRWRQLVALARVTASAYGYAAPGYKDACELLKV